MLVLAPTPDAVTELINEKDQLAFVRAFRQLMRLLNVLKTFTEFNFADLDMDAQTFEDYKSKYLDIYERTRSYKEAVSIVDDVDFELELIQRDEINVAYILELLAALFRQEKGKSKKDRQAAEEQKSAILDLLGKKTQLRSKRELIEKFIIEYISGIPTDQDIKPVFKDFWDKEKQRAIKQLCAAEKMDEQAVCQMIDDYHFTGKESLRETVFAALHTKPKLLERKNIFERVVGYLLSIVAKFDDGMGDLWFFRWI